MGPWRRLALFLAVMGPGLITGIVDDDSTGIAGYAIAGSRFGYNLLWTLILAAIALAIVGEMAARMGAVTGKGLGEVIRERFGVRITSFALLILLVANIATVIAEFAGIAGASEIFGVSRYIAVPLAALLVFVVVVFGSYRRVEKVLLTFSARLRRLHHHRLPRQARLGRRRHAFRRAAHPGEPGVPLRAHRRHRHDDHALAAVLPPVDGRRQGSGGARVQAGAHGRVHRRRSPPPRSPSSSS